MSNPLVEIINSASPWAIVCVLGAGAWKLLEALKDLKTQTAKGGPSKAEFDVLMARTKLLEDERTSEKSERSALASKVGTLWKRAGISDSEQLAQRTSPAEQSGGYIVIEQRDPFGPRPGQLVAARRSPTPYSNRLTPPLPREEPEPLPRRRRRDDDER